MTEPQIDPVTGKQIEPPPPDPNLNPETVPKAEFDALKGRLDAFEKGIQFGSRQNDPPPAAPPGPSLLDQVKEIDTKIDALDTQIDAAVKDGQPVSKLMRQRDDLTSKRLRMQIKHEDIDPAFATGIQTIDQLSDEVTRSKMTHLSIPEVSQTFERLLKEVDPTQRMNPKTRTFLYEKAVGENVNKILEVEKEKALREVSDPPKIPPGNNSRTSGNGDDTIPKPEEFLSQEQLDAIAIKGITVDEHFRRCGHPDGYIGWYKKHYVKKEEK